MSILSVFVWAVFGLAAGFIASKIVTGSGKGGVADMLLGLVGAVVGGAAFTYFGRTPAGVTEPLNLWSMLVAILGSVVVLVVYRAVTSRSAPPRSA